MKLPTISPQNVHRLKGLKSKLKVYNHLIIFKSKICKLNYHLSDVSKIQFKFFFKGVWKLCPTQRTGFFAPPVRSATPLPSLPVCYSPSRWYQWGPLQQRTSETCLSTTRPVVHPANIRCASFLRITFYLVVNSRICMSLYGYFVFFTKSTLII